MSGSVKTPSITSSFSSSVVIGLQRGASGEDSLPLCLLISLASCESSSSMSLSSPSLSSRILASKYLPTSEDTADYKYIKEILAFCSIILTL